MFCGVQVTAMAGLRHENVDRLIGVSSAERPFYLLTERHDRGTLRDCLRDGCVPSDNVEALFDVCIQASVVLVCHFYLRQRKGKEEYLYSAILVRTHTLKALRHGSHSFTCKQHHACLSFVSVHQMAPPQLRRQTSNCSFTTHLSTPKG